MGSAATPAFHQRTVLGRTGIPVSVAGLGCGGQSRLGRARGASEAESVRLVQRAIDLGINYLDTAQVYGTEEIVGQAIAGRRDQVVISTKVPPRPFSGEGPLLDAAGLRAAVDLSRRRLRVDTLDVFHLHGVDARTYAHSREVLVPELQRLRQSGAVRALAISERFGEEPSHATLLRALDDDVWDVLMVGFNLLNPSAARTVLPKARSRNVGVEVMYAVRRALSDPLELRRVVDGLIAGGHVAPDAIDPEDPLGFLVHEQGAASVVDAAYRWARHHAGVHVVLTGTGDVGHLEANVASIGRGPLPAAALARLERLFGHLDHLSAN